MNSPDKILQEIGKILQAKGIDMSYEEWEYKFRKKHTPPYIESVKERIDGALRSKFGEGAIYNRGKNSKKPDCIDRIEWECPMLESLASWPRRVPIFFLEIGSRDFKSQGLQGNPVAFSWGIRWWGSKESKEIVKKEFQRFNNKLPGRIVDYPITNFGGTIVAFVFKELGAQDLINCKSDLIDEIVNDFKKSLAIFESTD